jgi:hypothetical protein
MTVELPRTVEEELRALAAAITDVDEAAVAEVQAKLVGELSLDVK